MGRGVGCNKLEQGCVLELTALFENFLYRGFL